MSVLHGKGTVVWFNEIDVAPYLNAIGRSATRETADVTTFASGGNKEAIAGVRSATVNAAGFHDVGFTEPDDNLSDASGVLTWSPGAGTSIGDLARLASVIGTTFQTSSPAGGVVAFTWDAMTDGAFGIGQILHPKGEDTNTTTGASKDDAAATTTGWQAHLHVFAVDAGAWVISLEDSANNSAWSAVTGGAFASLSAAGTERLVSASGATLRRYVRYKATRTGGTAGDGITFGLAYARNAA